ncbi:MAG: TetR/AcrR family transcriptional regulator [Candidatus Heimdallarchaeota archaeon]|nr:MAG: TetR/AcrR family transcriptional regulator [Candidatus Heimdallarchaeota archaeon]
MKTTQERIIDEALKSFLIRGYENTSLNYLANQVNITKPAIYYYFQNKQELLSAVLDYLLKAIDQKYSDLFEQNLTLEATLKELFFSVRRVDRIFHGLTKVPPSNFNYHRLFFDCIKYLSSNSLINDSYERHKKLLTEKIILAQEKKQISSEIDPEILAFNIIATLEGTYLVSLYLPSLDVDLIVKKMFRTLKQILFR